MVSSFLVLDFYCSRTAEISEQSRIEREEIYFDKKMIIHIMNNARRVPLQFGGIISRDSMALGESYCKWYSSLMNHDSTDILTML